jgi:hypothetical protein
MPPMQKTFHHGEHGEHREEEEQEEQQEGRKQLQSDGPKCLAKAISP